MNNFELTKKIEIAVFAVVFIEIHEDAKKNENELTLQQHLTLQRSKVLEEC